MRQNLSPTDTKDRRGPRVSTICRSSLLGSAWQKNRSRHNWSILLSKLSGALFYRLFGVMGTDSVLACGITYRLAVARTFLKPLRKNGDQHFPLGFLLWIPQVSSDEAIRGYCRIPSACLRLRSGIGWRIKRPSSEQLWPITRCFPSRPWCSCS